MGKVVGFATSHGPTLTLKPDQWSLRGKVDRSNHELSFRGDLYDFETLSALRTDENLNAAVTLERMTENYERCQSALGQLRERFAGLGVSRAVIVGNDHKEVFSDECFAAFTVYSGGSILQVPFTEENVRLMPPGSNAARDGHTPSQPVSHQGIPDLADSLIGSLTADGFDLARSTILPLGKYGNRSIPHAFGFVYRQLMADRVVPNVPIFVNTFYPPNRPNAARCVKFGQALGRFLGQSSGEGTTAVIASGGLTHFVIDEELDQRMLEAMKTHDLKELASIDDALLESGTSESRNWIVVAAAMAELGKKIDMCEYVPCYRTEAGTGNAMGFVTWQ